MEVCIVSMMYEALQTTQVEDEVQSTLFPQDDMTLDDWVDVGISLVIAFLLAVLIVAHYPQFNNPSKASVQTTRNVEFLEIPDETVKLMTKPSHSENIAKPVVESKIIPVGDEIYQSKHILNGVFVSEDEKVAMVDNRFFSIGDSIDGMKVISIESDKIKLQNNSGVIELRIVV